MEDRQDDEADSGMNAGPNSPDLASVDLDDDFLEETGRRPLWQWLAGGIAAAALFVGLVAGFASLLERNVSHEPASAVLLDLPNAGGGAQDGAAGAGASAPDRLPATVAAASQARMDAGAAPAAPETAAPVPVSAPVPASLPQGPRIVLLLADAGANPALTRRAIEQLPREVAIGFNPYPDDLPALVQAARARGHEVWLGIPMEPLRYPQVDPGPQALLLASSPTQNIRRLDWALRRVEGEVGLYSIMGSAFTTQEAALSPVLAAIAERGLPFLDSRATGRTQSRRIAGKVGLPLLVNDSFVGSPSSPQAIDAQLATLERLAKARGLAVGVIEPSSLVLERLGQWAPGLAARNISLVPPRALLDAEKATRG